MKKTLAVRALLYSGELLAVDLGTFAIKVMSLKAGERSVTVHHHAQREIWRELADAATEADKIDIYAKNLRALVDERGLKARNASISLSGNAVIMRFLALPAGYKLDPETGLPPEAPDLIPFDVHGASISSLILDFAKGSKQARTEMILAVSQKKTVDDGMAIARTAGLRPAVIINDVLGLANAYEFFHGKQLTETVVLVDIGATSTSVGIMENGVTKATRVLNIAGNAFTRAIKRDLAVEFEEAERLKIVHGLAVPEGKTQAETAEAARVARALGLTVKDLSREIRRTMDVFLERRPPDYPPIHRIVLAGGSASLKGLADRLSADAGMTVDVFRPMVNVIKDNGALGIEQLAPALTVSCGLALSNTLLRRSSQNRINLVPKNSRRAAILRDISPGFWRRFVAPLILVGSLSVYAVYAVKVARKEAAMEQKLAAASQAERALRLKYAPKQKVAYEAQLARPPKPVKKPDPFAYLARLSISGVFGDKHNSLVMLNGGEDGYVARSGKLFDANEQEVPGVATEIRDNLLRLTAHGRTYSIELPK